MTKQDAKKRINEGIKKLNILNPNIAFELEETEYSVDLWCKSTTEPGVKYGSLSHISLFEDYANKTTAYEETMQYVEIILAAAKLYDPRAYFNMRSVA